MSQQVAPVEQIAIAPLPLQMGVQLAVDPENPANKHLVLQISHPMGISVYMIDVDTAKQLSMLIMQATTGIDLSIARAGMIPTARTNGPSMPFPKPSGVGDCG